MLKLFNLDLHISVIADVKNVLYQLYTREEVDIIDWSLSGHTWVFNKKPDNVEVIKQSTWENLDEVMIQNFLSIYRDYLSQFDGFIVTHALLFVRIFEEFDKPIIMINSCRYDNPYCRNGNVKEAELLTACLKRMYDKKLLIPIANNMGDLSYFYLGTGIKSTYIPSLCEYTNVKHDPIVGANRNAILYTGSCVPTMEKVIRRSEKYEWSDLFNAKALIHIPYEISTMSIFEQYTAGIPLFFPTKRFYKELVIYRQSYLGSSYWNVSSIPNHLRETLSFDWWMNYADYYETMPGIYYFDSWVELSSKLDHLNSQEHTDTMNHLLENRKKNILENWKKLMAIYFKY